MGFERRHWNDAPKHEDLAEELARTYRLELARSREILRRAERAAVEDPQARSVRQWFASLVDGGQAASVAGKRTLIERPQDEPAPSASRAPAIDPAVSPISDSPPVFDDLRRRGLHETLAALASMRGRHGLMEATLSAARKATRPALPSLTGRAAPLDPDGQAMWRAAERRASTLYRHAVESGELESADPAIEAALARAGGGQPLPAAVRRHMELELGISLARVRIHLDSVAAEAARAVRARAFAVGEDIFFADGAYAPETAAGLRLLAHELTHVVQTYQGRTETGGPGIKVSHPDEPLEREADAVADRIGQRGAAPDTAPAPAGRASEAPPETRSPGVSNPAIQRAPDPPKDPPQGPAERLKIDLNDLVRVKGSDGHSFKPRDMKKEPPLKEVRLADKIAAEAGDQFVFPRAKNEPSVDGFLKKSGRPVQLKSLTAKPEAQASKVVDHANAAFTKAAGWSNVDLHIEARDVSIAEVQARWNQENRVPILKPMPGGRITRIRVHCRDGIVDLPIPGAAGPGTPPPATPPPRTPGGRTPGGRKQFETRGRVTYPGRGRGGPVMSDPNAGRPARIGQGLAILIPSAMHALRDETIQHAVAQHMLSQWSKVEEMRRRHPTHFIAAVVSLMEWERPDPAGMVARMVNYVIFVHGATEAECEMAARSSMLSAPGQGWVEVGPFFGFIEPAKSLQEARAEVEKQSCFIATACHGSPDAPAVLLLRRFRDRVLQRSAAGRAFTEQYYAWSPPVAAYIAPRPRARTVVRGLLKPVVLLARIALWMEGDGPSRKPR